jgi:hypothetical protein
VTKPRPRFGGSADNPTRQLTPTGQTTRPIKPIHAHDTFEVDIDLDTGTIESVDLFDDGEDATQEISAVQLKQVQKSTEDFDLSLPDSSDEEGLPFYFPGGKRTPSPTPGPAIPSEKPRPHHQPKATPEPDFSALFDDPLDDESVSRESPPIHDLSLPPHTDTDPATPDGLPLFAPEPSRTTTPKSDSSPSQPQFTKGFTSGMAPLDISEFEPTGGKKKKKKDKRVSGRSGPAPMAGSKKVVRRRFIFTLTTRDIILLLLVLVLAAAVYVGWMVYQDIKSERDLAKLNDGQALIEKSKTEAIKEKEPKKEKDIP